MPLTIFYDNVLGVILKYGFSPDTILRLEDHIARGDVLATHPQRMGPPRAPFIEIAKLRFTKMPI